MEKNAHGLTLLRAAALMILVASTAAKTWAQNYFDENGGYFGPTEESPQYGGAYYTGNYTSPFKTYLGKTDAEIQAKLDELWNHYFKGGYNQVIYYESGRGEAYIKDTGNNDVRSEGISYGMMICVQTNHKEEFDKLWNWAKNHMWTKSGSWDGYFGWQNSTAGVMKDRNNCPDAEMYFMMSLLLAANRWHDARYMQDAQYILSRCWKNGSGSLFNEAYYNPTMPTPSQTPLMTCRHTWTSFPDGQTPTKTSGRMPLQPPVPTCTKVHTAHRAFSPTITTSTAHHTQRATTAMPTNTCMMPCAAP